MPERGDERECGGYTRRYYDEQWDFIAADDGSEYWRDKEDHVTYEATYSFWRQLTDDFLGDQIDKFDDDDEDGIWDEDEDAVDDN